jgi:transcriptional regulator with GAF, ATPase, and Fis domain
MARAPSGPIGSSTAPTPAISSAAVPVRRLVIAFSPVPGARGMSRLLGLLGPPALVLGRAPDGAGAWPLEDPQASRAHVRVTLDLGGSEPRAVLEDLGSRNGTFVSGVRVTKPIALSSGDVVRIGSHVLVYDEIPASAVAAATGSTVRNDAITGEHPTLREALARASQVAPTNEPVLLLGESGTGKELFAAHVHAASGRTGRFVTLNCASLPEALADSELFGHARGAYTGAQGAHDGLFAAADGGTLFLDEIGDAPAAIQAKLLRALESGEVRSLGESRARRVDARIVAATNLDVDRAIERGSFRGDLHARLAAHVLRLPPLRDRRSDVVSIAAKFLDDAAPEQAFTADTAEALLLAPYPRNVRELLQALRHARAASHGVQPIELRHLPDEIAAEVVRRGVGATTEIPGLDLLTIRRDVPPTRDELARVLAHFEDNVSRAAEFFGKDRRQIYRWAEKLGLTLDQAR